MARFRASRLLSCRRCGFAARTEVDDDATRHDRYYHQRRVELQRPETTRAHALGFIDHWSRRLALPSGATLFEVGCAEGTLLRCATERGLRATGIDITDEYVHLWRRDGLAAELGTAEDFSKAHRDLAFDVVVARQVIEHVRRPDSFVEAMAALTRPGGSVLIETGDPGSVQARLSGDHWSFLEPLEGGAAHVSFVSARAARALGERSGLAFRASVPYFVYRSFAAYRAERGGGLLRRLAAYAFHRSGLGAGRCYWLQRTSRASRS